MPDCRQSNSIQEFIDFLQQIHFDVADKIQVSISVEEVLSILVIETKMGLIELSQQDWSTEKIIKAIEFNDSIKNKPLILAKVDFECSIIPEGTERSIYEELIKNKGERWLIHKYDADPFPSNPHAHNTESNLKLHLGNGDLYLKKKKVGTLPKKALISLRDKIKHLELQLLEV